MRVQGIPGHAGTPYAVTAGPRVTTTRGSLFESLPPQPEWMKDAVCASTDPESFFPERGGSPRDAKKFCLSCPVRAQCLAYAMGRDERFGVWGGLSERERRRLKRALRDQRIA